MNTEAACRCDPSVGHWCCAEHAPSVVPPAGSTLAILDDLRGLAEEFREDGEEPETQAIILAAADHLDDLAAANLALEADIARLNEQVETYRKAFRHAEQWLRWIAIEAEDFNVVRAPSDLSRHCAGIVSLVEPIPQNREETPAP